MRDEQDGAVEVRQDGLQYFLGGQIEVVGGLVQQEQVSALQGQGRPGPAARARPPESTLTFLKTSSSVKRNFARYFRTSAGSIPGAIASISSIKRKIWVQIFVGLGKVADVQVRSQFYFPGKRRKLLQQGLEEGGLARPVGADDGRAFPTQQGQVGQGKEGLLVIVVTDVQVAGAQHQIAGAVAGLQVEVDAPRGGDSA